MRYSAFSLAWNALTHHARWQPPWRDAALQDAYDAVIGGGGGHCLVTAYYLAKQHGIANVAVLPER